MIVHPDGLPSGKPLIRQIPGIRGQDESRPASPTMPFMHDRRD